MEDFVSKRRTFNIFNITLRNFPAVKSSKQRFKHDEFYFVGFVLVRNSTLFASNRKSRTVLNNAFFRNVPWPVLIST